MLIHFPHGLGDMAMLGFMIPLLGMNRFFLIGGGSGDPSIFHGSERVTPLYTAMNNISHRGGSVFDLEASPEVLARLAAENVTHVIYGLPEIWGQSPYPWHTKARARLRALAPQTDEAILRRPLANAISLAAPADVERLVEDRLRSFGLGPGRRLCLLSHYGVTHSAKDWAPDQARRFAQRLGGPWLVVSLETGRKGGLGGVAIPSNSILDGIAFGVGLRALCKFTDLFVGVPSGPYCVSCLYDHFPTIAIWQSLWPSWYMEPKYGINLIGKIPFQNGWDKTPGAIIDRDGLHYPTAFASGNAITADEVLEHVKPWI